MPESVFSGSVVPEGFDKLDKPSYRSTFLMCRSLLSCAAVGHVADRQTSAGQGD